MILWNHWWRQGRLGDGRVASCGYSEGVLRGRDRCRHADVGRLLTRVSSVSICGVRRIRSRLGWVRWWVIPQNQQWEVGMNGYGLVALGHWRRHRPAALAMIPDPEVFFSTLGLTVSARVEDLADRLAGPDRLGEGYLEKVGRLNAAKSQAEELVLAELVYLAEPETTDEDLEDEDDDPMWRLQQQWAQQDRAERQRELLEANEAADQAWRERTNRRS